METPPAKTEPSAIARWTGRALGWIGIQREGDRLRFKLDPTRLSAIFAVAVVAVVLSLFVQSLIAFELFSAYQTVDEAFIYYQVARNFNEHGFMNSYFLQDLSTSAKASEHPYVYNHMPPGPEIAIALITRAVGENYRVVRVVLALMFLSGLVCFFRYAEGVARGMGLAGAGIAFAFIHPQTLLHSIDHPAFCLFPLAAFFPPLAVQAYERSKKKAWLAAALAMTLAASFYLIYQNLLMVLTGWMLFSWTGLAPIRRRLLVALVATGVAGIGLHLAQNWAYLGTDVFFKELTYTVSNRMTGKPTAGEMTAFYHDHGLVRHGTNPFDLGGYIDAFRREFTFPGRGLVGVVAVLLIVREAFRTLRREEGRWTLPLRTEAAGPPAAWLSVLAAIVAVVGTVAAPLIVFPSYSIYCTSGDASQFFTSLVAAVVVLLAIRELGRLEPTEAPASEGLFGFARSFRSLVIVGLWAAMAWKLWGTAETVFVQQSGNYKEWARHARRAPFAGLLKLREIVGGRVVMTNAESVMVGFLTRDSVFGGCELDAFLNSGQPFPGGCFRTPIRGYSPMNPVPVRHFVFFKALLPGFTALHRPEELQRLRDRLDRAGHVLYEDPVYAVYEFGEPHEADRRPRGP